MTAASNYLENEVLRAYLVTKTPYIALYGVDPGDANNGGEITGGSYARKAASFNVANGVATLAADVVFTGMPAVEVGAVAIWDGPAQPDATLPQPNMLFHGPLVAPKSVQAGDAFAFPAGNLTIAMD